MSEKSNNPRGPEIRRPTPEQHEALKCAAAFALGYCQAIYEATYQPTYYQRFQTLKQDLIDFGCFDAEGQLNQPYLAHRLRGLAKGTLELTKVGLV